MNKKKRILCGTADTEYVENIFEILLNILLHVSYSICKCGLTVDNKNIKLNNHKLDNLQL